MGSIVLKEGKMRAKKINENVWVVIPAYNEAGSIGDVLDQFMNEDYSVLVVDDCSKDNTTDIILNYPVILLKHSINLGQGAALQTGFEYILNRTDAKYIISFDSDGQHNIKDIPTLLAPLKTGDYDVTLGSRFLMPESVKGMPFSKKIILKLGVLYTLITTRLKLTDTHNGLRGFSRGTLKHINITQNRMAHASEILDQIAHYKLRYCEVPVTIQYTEYSKKKGQSIFNSLNILWDLFFGRNY
jgi:glycosyltransferase involved in cell wall biosynthesis